MNGAAVFFTTLLALQVALPAAAQVKKKPEPRAKAVVAAPVLPPPSGDQLAAAALTYFGDYRCEFGKKLRVSRNPKFDGYVDLLFAKQVFTLKPILSRTGALRLEDTRGRLLVVQIADVSMVMDVQLGQRLVDDCVHETQSENRRQSAAVPARPGLGIDPMKTAAFAAAQAASAPTAAAVVVPVQAAVVAPAVSASAAIATPPAATAASGADAGKR